MPVTPILEVIVLWHPDDTVGNEIADTLIAHFHGPAYAGLAGGAVEVYIRSEGWSGEGTPPRPIPALEGDPVLGAPQFTAIVPVLGRALARAVRDDDAWRDYVSAIFEANKGPHGSTSALIVLPLLAPGASISGGTLDGIAGPTQYLPSNAGTDPVVLTREVAQGISQSLPAQGGERRARTTVFVSHTKHAASKHDSSRALVSLVREVLDTTHLGEFFDASDLQPGEDWEAALEANASASALLMLRTDLYSSREWTQREVHAAKIHDVPIVCVYAVRDEERRGSFLLDHVPVVACPPGAEREAIERALGRLVDEVLKQTLWEAQRVYLFRDGFDWLPVHSPEMVTIAAWLRTHPLAGEDAHLVVMHPDPPLQPRETQVLLDLCELAGARGVVDILTPRTFAMRGGRLT
jgi:hypothetical protein